MLSPLHGVAAEAVEEALSADCQMFVVWVMKQLAELSQECRMLRVLARWSAARRCLQYMLTVMQMLQCWSGVVLYWKVQRAGRQGFARDLHDPAEQAGTQVTCPQHLKESAELGGWPVSLGDRARLVCLAQLIATLLPTSQCGSQNLHRRLARVTLLHQNALWVTPSVE